MDLDQGGIRQHLIRQYMGPTIGWVQVPENRFPPIFVGGTYAIDFSVTYVPVAAANVIIILPLWFVAARLQAVNPGLNGLIPITVADIGGTAQGSPIIVQPTGPDDTISGLTSYTINVNYGSATFIPDRNLPGWTIQI
jgi:hypothetical protein